MVNSKMSNITQIQVNTLAPFTLDYSSRLSASEIARRTKIPQQTASRYLNKLVKDNLLEYKREGRNKLFSLDLKKETSRIILNSIENEKSLQFLLKNKGLHVIIEEILGYCDSLIVFGSYASGTFNEDSDLDLVIFGKADKEEIKKVKRKSGLEIVEHYVSHKEFEKILLSNNPLSLEILNNHIIFGDLSGIVNIFLRKIKK